LDQVLLLGEAVQNKPRILVVEDDHDLQVIYQVSLGHIADIVTAGSIASAMKELSSGKKFVLVILDGRVPRFDDEPLRPGDTTIVLAQHLSLLKIPALSASGDDNLNDLLASKGCMRADKLTAIKKAKQFLAGIN
jgi:CheY-like chemotaxis protein